jgi:hypothetical protein
MKGVRKRFSNELYTKYDGPAKKAVSVHLELSGHEVTIPPENYGVDLYSQIIILKQINERLTMFHEIEVSRCWKKGAHPYKTGSIPERKSRLKALYTNKPLYFWMLRYDLRRALVFGAYCLKDKFLIEVPNRLVRAGEFFYRPPKQLGKEFDLLPITEE